MIKFIWQKKKIMLLNSNTLYEDTMSFFVKIFFLVKTQSFTVYITRCRKTIQIVIK